MPGLGFAEMGPGDLSLSLGSVKLLRDPYPPVMQAARDKVFAACRRNGIAFLEGCNPENITARLDEGVRVISGHSEEMAHIGREHQHRKIRVEPECVRENIVAEQVAKKADLYLGLRPGSDLALALSEQLACSTPSARFTVDMTT